MYASGSAGHGIIRVFILKEKDTVILKRAANRVRKYLIALPDLLLRYAACTFFI